MRILIPVDGSAASLDAIHHVLALFSQGLPVEWVLANVQDNPHLYEVVLAPDPAVLAGAAREVGEDMLIGARAVLEAAGQVYEYEIATGDAGPELVDLAERVGAEAIVMGSQGHGLLGGARLGSVCQYVLQHASVPVTIVRHADPEPAEGE
jgi:nucleotide-binding universal stress UspA family protein